MIPIYQPYLPRKSLNYAHKVLNSSWISNLGEYKNLANLKLKSIIGCQENILTNNGTTATHLIYKALKYKVPNLKHVLVPNNVYVAAWNSMLFDGDNVNLIPIKTNIDTWNIDIDDLVKEASTRSPEDTAILIVHNVGGIINVPSIKRKLPNYKIIEDNCEGFLGKYENKFSGTSCLASSISFYGNKTITCGEGGAVIINDNSITEFLTKLHSQGQSNIRYMHDILGYNYRMTNLQSSILFGQFEMYEEILKNKKRVFERYKNNLKKCKKIVFQHQEENCENALWMFAIRILNSNYKDASIFFNELGIETRNMFYPMSYHKHLQKYVNVEKEKECEILSREIIIFPSSPSLKNKEIDFICKKIIEFCNL